MKHALALAFASLFAASAPAQAARYITFEVTSIRGHARATFDTQTTPPNTPINAQGGNWWAKYFNDNFVWSFVNIDAHTDYDFVGVGWSVIQGTAYFPAIDYSQPSFSYSFTPPFTGESSHSSWYEAAQIFGPGNIDNSRYAYFAVDDITITGSDDPHGVSDGPIYDLDSRALPPVPEPSTWAMMICGVGAIGAIVRRKGHVPKAKVPRPKQAR